MKKIMILILPVTLIPMLLLGCQSESSNVTSTLYQQQAISQTNSNNIENDPASEGETLTLEGEIKKVTISKIGGNGKVNFDDSISIETFTQLITNAVRIRGIVDMIEPNYKMEVVYTNEEEQSFYLWIANKGQSSSIMKSDDTHTIYTVSEEMTDKLREIINRNFE